MSESERRTPRKSAGPMYASKKAMKNRPKTEEELAAEAREEAERIVKRSQRRTQTSKSMASSASNDKLRALLDDAMSNIAASIARDGTPEDRLKAIMTKAKETGMSVKKIFSYFTNDPNHFTKEEFKNGMMHFGDNLFNLEDDEINEIISKFDVDGDGTISIAEFKLYCYYQIPTVSWKAERRRMEASGEMEMIKKVVAGHMHHDELHKKDTLHEGDEDENEEEGTHVHGAGELVNKTTKLFWRTNTTVDVRLYYSMEIDIISIQVFNQTEDKEMPTLYVKKSDIEANCDKEKLEEDIKVAIQTADTREAGQSDIVRDRTMWDFFTNYLLARLKIPDTSNPFPKNEMANKLPPLTPRTESLCPFLCKLSDDKYESLMIPKPQNIHPPPPVPREVVISVSDFMTAFDSFKEGHDELKKLRTSAEKMSKLMALSISAFSNAEHDRHRRAALNSRQRLWLDSFTRWIVRQQVVQVKKLLETSPAYMQLLAETEEKRSAKAIGLPEIEG
ncbi:hypothetical protein TrRE_jg6999 [Triparma retinervis]|uniref:EF-hand domain-containing protein n=1 Tax=Triparma retinervis TaxID=2557542 RepID=A0A9W6Z7C5_9STRA|nr:hypothetical protein TrRE_jg6999 [Triparma retinervis]